MRPFLYAAAWLSLSAWPAIAGEPCDTVVIPSGIGQSDPESVTGLNPLISQSLYNAQARLLLYRPLVWIGQDDTLDAERSLAENIAVSDDGKTFRVTLKAWKWSDGAPVTADDVVFTWEEIRELGPIFAWQGQGGLPDRVASVRAIGPRDVEFRLIAPTNPEWFELNALSQIPALPRHAWGAIGRDEMWRRQTDPSLFAVVDGPFRIAEWKLDRYLALERNPLYGGHRPAYRRLVIDFLQGTQALQALQAGEVDMAHVPLALLDRVRADPALTLHTLPQTFGYEAITLNLKNDRVGFFRDRRVRQALTDATDQKTMIDLIYRGLGSEARLPIPPEPATYLSATAGAGKLPVRYDPDLAARLLDQAGWTRGADGVRRHGGQALAFTLMVSEGALRVLQAQMLQQDMRRAGVEMALRVMSFGELMETLYGPPDQWQAILSGWTLQGVPDGSSYFDTGGANNAGGYSDAATDRLILDSVNRPGRQAIFAYGDHVAEEQPWNFLPEPKIALAVAAGVGGVEAFTNPQGFWSPEYLFFTGARACDATRDR